MCVPNWEKKTCNSLITWFYKMVKSGYHQPDVCDAAGGGTQNKHLWTVHSDMKIC